MTPKQPPGPLHLAPLLYDDEQPAAHSDPVAPAEPSETARDKAATCRNSDDYPVFSFRGLLDKLQGLRRTAFRVARGKAEGSLTYRITEPDPVQKEALRLVGVKL